MMIVFPIMILGGFWLVKPKAKKLSSFHLVETGFMEMLPKDGWITIDLRVHQMLEIIAVSSPAMTWLAKVNGKSVRVDRKTRTQDVTAQWMFEIKSVSTGDSKIVFEKLSSDGKLLESRNLRIAVMG